jgi:AbrB family looped-hinge helix DNA binding protein
MRVTTKGQVTIPQEVREALGLLPHTEVTFTIERGAAVIRPARGTRTRGARIAAHLKAHAGALRMSSRDLLKMLRDEPDEIDAR